MYRFVDLGALLGKHRPVSYEWKNRLKLKTLWELPIVLEESIEEYTSNEWSENRKMSICNPLDLESLGSWPTIYICPKNSQVAVRSSDRGDFGHNRLRS
jgi:hypothetical protein